MRRYTAQGMKRDKALGICGVSKHQYYYRSKKGKRGRKRSRYTMKKTEVGIERIQNKEVVDHIRQVLKNPWADHGYHRMTGELTLAGFFINHKKVYRLMKQNKLLQTREMRLAKQYVRYRIICPEGPLRLMEMDIKVVWIEGLCRYGYILTILDVFTRVVLHWDAGYHMRQAEVQQVWQKIIADYLEPYGCYAWEIHIEIRSDNAPQFSARDLREYFKVNYFAQTYTHPYTPQENGHIESFHAILGKALEGQYFEDIYELRHYLETFYQYYNYERIHGSIAKLPPMTFWHLWETGKVERKVLNEKARKVRFKLLVPRQEIKKIQPSDNGSLREVSSLDLVGLDAVPNPMMQTDGPVLNAQSSA